MRVDSSKNSCGLRFWGQAVNQSYNRENKIYPQIKICCKLLLLLIRAGMVEIINSEARISAAWLATTNPHLPISWKSLNFHWRPKK